MSITCKFNITSQNGKYYYKLENFPIPVDINSVTIEAYRVNNLKMFVPLFGPFGITKEAKANENGVAVITINRNINKGSYTIELSGNTNHSNVNIEATVKSALTLDQNGEYKIDYDTSKLPVGDLIINAGGEKIKAHIVEELPTPTTATTTATTTIAPSTEEGNEAITTTPTTVPTTVTTVTTTPTMVTTAVPTTVVTTIPTTVTTKIKTIIPQLPPDILSLKVKPYEINSTYYVNISLVLPNPCYVIRWHNLTSKDSTFIIKGDVIRLNKVCIQVLTKRTKIFKLGKLNPKEYKLRVSINESYYKLNLSIHPKYVECKAGDSINYTLTIDWKPAELRGLAKITATLNATGFKKSYTFEIKANPPINKTITVKLPENLSSGKYLLRIDVSYGKLKASDTSTIEIIPQKSPGFVFVIGLLSMLLALVLRSKLIKN